MVKEKRILSYFIGWLIVGFIICFIGITNVFADEKLPLGYLSDKSNIQVVVPYNGSPLTLDQFGEYYLDDVDELLIFVDNYEFIGGKIYELELYLPNATLTNANTFTVTGNTSNNETVSCDAMEILQENKKYVHYKWRCNKDVNSLTFNIKNSNDENIVSAGIFRWDYTYLLEVTSTTDNSEIIDGLNKVEQSIIDSNKETQEVIKDQFNSCRPSVNLFSFNNYTQPQADTTIEIINSNKGIVKLSTNSKYRYIYVFINGLEKNTNYTFNGKFINSNENMQNLWFSVADNPTTTSLYNNSYSSGTDVTFNTGNATAIIIFLYASGSVEGPNEATWYDIQLQKGDTSTTFEPYGEEICSNKIDDTNDKLDGIQGALTDSSAPNTSGLENSAGWLPAGPLDSILNLPLTMLNSLTNSLGKTCAPLNLTLPYVNKNIEIPCLSTIFSKITGVNGLWTWVGTIASVLILYNYLLNLYAWVDRVLTLRAEFDEAMGADMANWGRL